MEDFNSDLDPDPPEAEKNKQPRCLQFKLDATDLHHHNSTMHSEVETTAPHCYRCNLVMKSWKIVRAHIKNSFLLPDGRYSCVALNNPPYTCPKTGNVFKSHFHFKLHLSRFNKQKLKCTFCDKDYGSKKELVKHIRKRHPNQGSGTETDSTRTTNGQTNNNDTTEDLQRCAECLKVATHIQLHKLIYHQKNKEKDGKRYYCPYCDRSYARPSDALNHALRSELLENGQRACTVSLKLLKVQKKHQCRICSEWFGRKDVLKRHFRKVHKNPVSEKTRSKLLTAEPNQKEVNQLKLSKQVSSQETKNTSSTSAESTVENSSKKLPENSNNPTKIEWSMIQSWIKGCDIAECSEPTEFAQKLKTAIRAVHFSEELLENEKSTYTSENKYCNHCQRNVDHYQIHRLIAHQGKNSKSFVCPLCNSEFARQDAVWKHLESSAVNGKGTFSCMRSKNTQKCLSEENMLVLASAYEYFCKLYIKRERLCPKCDKAYYSKDGLIQHMKMVHKCPTRVANSSTQKIDRKSRSHNPSTQTFGCSKDTIIGSNILKRDNDDGIEFGTSSKCNYLEPSNDDFERNSSVVPDSMKSLEFNDDLSKQMNTYSWCKLCKRNVRNFKMHDLIMHSEKGQTLPKCFRCGKTIKTVRFMENHVRNSFLLPDGRYSCVAMKEPPYTCPETGKIFKSRYQFQQHLSKFSKINLYCRLCSKSFKTKGSLENHILLHHPHEPVNSPSTINNTISFTQPNAVTYDVPGTPARCDECIKVTSHLQLHKLIYHQKNKEKGDNYYCPYCNKCYVKASTAMCHALRSGLFENGKRACTISLKLMKLEKKFNCKICNEWFISKAHVRRHIFRLHKDIVPAQYQSQIPIKKQKTIVRKSYNVKNIAMSTWKEATNYSLSSLDKLNGNLRKPRKSPRKGVNLKARAESEHQAALETPPIQGNETNSSKLSLEKDKPESTNKVFHDDAGISEEPQYIMIPVFPKQPRKRRMKNNQYDSDPDYNPIT